MEVDELRLKIHPVVLGAGVRLFGGTSDKKPMRLVDTQTLDDGVVFLTYKSDQRPSLSSAVVKLGEKPSG
jgi:dihydrofolate reductase